MTGKEFTDMVNLAAEIKRQRDTEMAERLEKAQAEATRLKAEATANRKTLAKALPHYLAEYRELKAINPRSETQQEVFTKLEAALVCIDNLLDTDPEFAKVLYK